MSFQRREIFGFVGLAAACLIAAVPSVRAQPQSAPPKRVSADAASKAIGGPTLITLRFKSEAPLTVLESLAQQAGMALDAYNVRDSLADMKPIAVELVDQPFWVAVRNLTARLNMGFSVDVSPNFWSSDKGWTLSLHHGRDSKMQGPAQIRGPFLIIASSVARSVDLMETGKVSAGQQAIVEFVVLVDPKLRTRGSPKGRDLEVLDAKGARLKPVERDGVWTQEVESRWPLMWRAKAVVNLDGSKVQKLSIIKGTLRGLLATTASEAWEVTDILQAKDLSKEAGDARFFIRQITKDGDEAEPVYTVALGSNGTGEELDFGWPARSDHDRVSAVRLVDGQGRDFFPQSSRHESGTFVVEFRPGQRAGPATEGEPVKLLWELPTQVVEMEIPLEFKDLPIP